jgi:hypothetical protein
MTLPRGEATGDLAGDRDWLEECGKEELRKLALEMPPPSLEVRDRETRLLLDDLALFAEAEATSIRRAPPSDSKCRSVDRDRKTMSRWRKRSR